MQDAREDFDRAGGDLVLIGQATPQDAANFRRQFNIDLPVLADERRVSYRAIGAKMSGVGGLIGPKMLLRAVPTVLGKRVTQGRTIGHRASSARPW